MSYKGETSVNKYVPFAVIAFMVSMSFSGCMYNNMLSHNNEAITHLSLGMTKTQVTDLMKDYKSIVVDGELYNPYRSEASQRGSDTYEVLYYLTSKHPPFTPIQDSQATPIVLKNGVVIGWGKVSLQSVGP